MNVSDLEDVTLVKAIARGDEGALGTLYRAHGGRVYGYLLRLLGRADDAEEVLDDLFMGIWQRASSYDGSRGTPLTWIFNMARSRAIDQLRRRRRQDRPLDLPAEVPADPHAEVWAMLQAEQLRTAIAALPSGERRVLETCYFQGYSQSEAAEALSIPLGTVKTRARAALNHLRTGLRETGALA